MTPAAIALNRFGLGARPDEPAPPDPQRWLLSQLDSYEPLPAPWKPRPRTPALVEVWRAAARGARSTGGPAQRHPRGLPAPGARRVRGGGRRAHRQRAADAHALRRAAGALLVQPLRGVGRQAAGGGLAGGFEADAIRPHVLGRFEDLLLAAVRHPAMLLYLDQAQSIGPGSRPAARRGAAAAPPRPQREPGARDPGTAHAGRAQRLHAGRRDRIRARAHRLDLAGERARPRRRPSASCPRCTSPARAPCSAAAMRRAASSRRAPSCTTWRASPATARHIARKLARHFVADDPPPALVERLAAGLHAHRRRPAQRLPRTGRSARGMAARPTQVQVAVGVGGLEPARARPREMPPTQAPNLMTQLGQPVWRPGSPAGYDDGAATWAAPDALMRRVEMAQRLAHEAGNARRRAQPRAARAARRAERSHGAAIARADSGGTALALLLVSPEFLRR